MNYILLIAYLIINFKFIQKDWIFIIPLIFAIFTNFFGLIDNELVQLPGKLDVCDLGLFLSFFLIIKYYIMRTNNRNIIFTTSLPYKLFLLYFFYLIFLFIYTLIITKGELVDTIKISRTQYYCIAIPVFFYLINYKASENRYDQLMKFINVMTVLFSIAYIIQNQFDITLFGAKNYEEITLDGIEAKRNFLAFPFFLPFATIYNLNNLIESKKVKTKMISLVCYVILMLALIYALTRGLLITSLLMSFITLVYRKQTVKSAVTIGVCVVTFFVVLNSQILNQISSFKVLMDRMLEITNSGISNTGNFEVRNYHLLQSINNVLNFNPYFGFGFSKPDLLGYTFQGFHAGNPDNAFTNIIGMQGFVGLFLFLSLIASWLFVNIKLRQTHKSKYSKIHFILILWFLMSAFNGSTFSYLYTFGLYFAYDVISYYNTRFKKINNNVHIVH